MRYRVSSTDELGASITAPYADDPQPNFAYFVYNGDPDWTGSDEPGVRRRSTTAPSSWDRWRRTT